MDTSGMNGGEIGEFETVGAHAWIIAATTVF